MNESDFNNAKEIWNQIVKSDDNAPYNFKFELQEQLLHLFHVGTYYYYIFNCGTANFELVDSKALQMLGYQLSDMSPEFLVSKLHPEDVPFFLNFENTITNFYLNLPVEKLLNYKTSYDIRIKTNKGKYIRVLQQVTPVQSDDQGSIFRTFGVHTDITHIKPEGKPILNIIGMHGEPSYYNVQSNPIFEPAKKILTKREQEVLHLIAEGKTTVEIAETLFVSPETIKKHRKHILAKLGSRNTAELIANAIDKGLL